MRSLADVVIIKSLEPWHGRPGQLSGHYAIKHPSGENMLGNEKLWAHALARGNACKKLWVAHGRPG